MIVAVQQFRGNPVVGRNGCWSEKNSYVHFICFAAQLFQFAKTQIKLLSYFTLEFAAVILFNCNYYFIRGYYYMEERWRFVPYLSDFPTWCVVLLHLKILYNIYNNILSHIGEFVACDWDTECWSCTGVSHVAANDPAQDASNIQFFLFFSLVAIGLFHNIK